MLEKLLSVFFTLLTILGGDDTFIKSQKGQTRIADAYKKAGSSVDDSLKKAGINRQNYHLLLIAYKQENELQVWARNENSAGFKKVCQYEICARSGKPGPKSKQGDGQVPEGFYHVDRFNPESKFHLSLGINYPNKADAIRGESKNLGGDIFIHGGCVTIGCLPITNQKIEELYLLALEANKAPQKGISTYIFPCKMEGETLKELHSKYPQHVSFWKNLKTGYDKFKADKKALQVSTDKAGKYVFP